jgi:hypothetical protein
MSQSDTAVVSEVQWRLRLVLNAAHSTAVAEASVLMLNRSK